MTELITIKTENSQRVKELLKRENINYEFYKNTNKKTENWEDQAFAE